jgi:hypothetical protein
MGDVPGQRHLCDDSDHELCHDTHHVHLLLLGLGLSVGLRTIAKTKVQDCVSRVTQTDWGFKMGVK